MDTQIEHLEAALAKLDEQSMEPETIVQDILKPKDEIREKIVKYQVKEEALAATVLGLKQQGLDDIEESLR